MIHYAITDRSAFAGEEEERRAALINHAVHLAISGVDFIQVREKDLPFHQAADLAVAMLSRVRDAGSGTQVLLNATWQNAAQWPAGVGLHLSSSALSLLGAQEVGLASELPTSVSVSCHGLDDLAAAQRFATVLLYAPVFEKRVSGMAVHSGMGLEALAAICRSAAPLPVLAMGGVTRANAAACLAAGASGIAGIRLFQPAG